MRVTHICFNGVLFCTEERPHIGAMYVRVNTGATVRRHACPECLKKLPEALYDSVIIPEKRRLKMTRHVYFSEEVSFVALAEAIKGLDLSKEDRFKVAGAIADVCLKFSSSFNVYRFLAACGVEL